MILSTSPSLISPRSSQTINPTAFEWHTGGALKESAALRAELVQFFRDDVGTTSWNSRFSCLKQEEGDINKYLDLCAGSGDKYRLLTARENGKLIAIVELSIRDVDNERRGELACVVADARQRRGIGTNLFAKCKQYAKEEKLCDTLLIAPRGRGVAMLALRMGFEKNGEDEYLYRFSDDMAFRLDGIETNCRVF